MIDWSRSAAQLWNQVRGLNPFPGAYTLWNGEVMKVWASANPKSSSEPRSRSFSEISGDATVPGTVLGSSEQGIEVMTGEGTLWLTEIQPSGKKAMPVSEFVRGVQIPAGTVFG